MTSHHPLPPLEPAREPIAPPSPPESPPNPPTQTDAWDQLGWPSSLLVSVIWLVIGVWGQSSWGDALFGLELLAVLVFLVWTLGTAGFLFFWLTVLCVAGWSLATRNLWRALKLATFLLPMAAAFGLFLFLQSERIPLRVRFDLSEAAMNDVADDFEASNDLIDTRDRRVGLFSVSSVHQEYGCTLVQTGSGFLGDSRGFARCDGAPPDDDLSLMDMEHLDGDWWTWRLVSAD